MERRLRLGLKPNSAVLAHVNAVLNQEELGSAPRQAPGGAPALQPLPQPLQLQAAPPRALHQQPLPSPLPAGPAASLAALRSPLQRGAPPPAAAAAASAARRYDTLDKRRYAHSGARAVAELSQEQQAAEEARAAAEVARQLAAVRQRNRAARDRLLRYASLFGGGGGGADESAEARERFEGLRQEGGFEGARLDAGLLARMLHLLETRARRLIREGLCARWRHHCEVRRLLNR